ncbi:C-terminal processing protease CtpA/Prc [Pedobacter sp. AK013]|uniref:S41 family peptidase n=1 Tax=Pedobacter sp. AK013 TaxID=2723071 RepID=UPI00161FA0B3|nr:S41 family peptidase [Pedobacter sp. AK013]MBB6237492.1 C-terminal processing protease CtpA/Prc [Pedobacter sp. AK013]
MTTRTTHLKRTTYYSIYFVILFLAILPSCKKGNKNPNYPIGSNENINTWILDSLKRYYYWNEQLPADPNLSLSPKDFFNSIRNPSDRFSYISIPNDPTTATPSNRNFGFDYATVSDQNSAKIIGIIKVVLKDSPASRAGLKRGDYISKINGKTLTVTNAQALQTEILNSDRFSLGLAELNNNSWTDTRTVELNKGIILDQREISKVMESDEKKIGYLYFLDFNGGLARSLTPVFSNFKAEGISELILDLRYNAGGQVAEAAGLCAMIAKNISFDKPFITYKGNKNGGAKTESIGTAATFDGTVNFNTLLQQNLGLSRVYILSTAATASASEVMINNLKPFIQVVLIGEKTRGKDEASFRIFDARSPKQVNWEMHPIVYKLFNAQGIGGYSAGINPDIAINEMSILPLLQPGDAADPMVKAAIASITGKAIKTSVALNNVIPESFKADHILMDSRAQSAQQSIVTTHRLK